ncbi:MAG: hypothetical protein WC529_05550 [Candidatus Margulisiibacteriota bacterium]
MTNRKKRKKRNWHSNFNQYMQAIVNHPNYAGMPDPYKEDGEIRWVVTRQSEVGKKRLEWWDKKRKELGIKKGHAWISKVARKIHPFGEKPCQICGKEMSLDYIYPNKRGGKSPGAMSNAPDRFDGYHTYNLCCRSKHDTGRHKKNLERYGEDRRAYENWADGDWKAASWLMKVFNKFGLSPDHIGPISLGFAHRPKFQPLTPASNSAKNNRMSLADVKTLIKDESSGDAVVSWHSRFLWEKLKHKVISDRDAGKLSKLMRINLHCVLTILANISSEGFNDFLVNNFLHPEYAYYSIEFIDFDPSTGTFRSIVKKKGSKKQYHNNATRYVRISLESLRKYVKVGNRNVKGLINDTISAMLKTMITQLSNNENIGAKNTLFSILDALAVELASKF